MGLFTRKPRVRLEVFCREFYERQILNPVVAGMDLSQVYCETVKKNTAEADPRFATVDMERFHSEETLIYLEVFGLAWLHQCGDRHAAAQSAFTRTYLEGCGRADIWANLEWYNQAIARSSTLGLTSETPRGRAHLTFTNAIRCQLFEQWVEQGFDSVAAARAANRVSTEVAWDKGLAPAFLMLTLYDRLSCEVNEQAQSRLVAMIRGLYDGVRQSLKLVRIEA